MTSSATDLPAAPLERSFQRFAAVACGVSAVVAALVLFGWFLDIGVLKSVVPGFATMKFNTAAGFLLAALALGLASPESASARNRKVAAGLSAALFLLAGLTLAEYAFDWNAGLDELLVRDSSGSQPPGRMSAATAQCFAFLSVGILLLDQRWRRFRPAPWFALMTMIAGLVGVLGYLYHVKALYRFFIYSSMALHTSLLFVLLGAAVLAARPNQGIMAVITSARAGGYLARRALLAFSFLSIFLGWLRLNGEDAGYYETEIGTALFTLAMLLASGIAIWFGARRLNRLHAELEERHLANARLAAIVESSSDAIVAKSLDGFVTAWNRGAEAIFGFSAAEMIGQPIERIIPPERAEEEEQIRACARRGERVNHFETTRRRKDGRSIHVSVTISPIQDAGGRVVGVSTMARDITERILAVEALRKAEEQRRLVIENLTEGLIISDGVQLHWNPAAWRMHGFAEPESSDWRLDPRELERLFELRTLEGASLEPEDWPTRLTWRGGAPPRNLELLVRRRESDWERAFSYTGAAARDPDRGQIAFLTIQDVTARVRAEESLKRHAADLARSNQDLEQFAYVASHDLQEPLRAVAGCLEILERRYRDQLEDRARELIRHAVDGAKRMQALIDGLLAFSRVGRQGEFTEVNLNEVLASALKNLSVSIEETGARISLAELPVIHGEFLQLALLFQNLIGNAIKFRGEAPPEIQVAAEKKEGFWEISVRDNGIGVDPRYFERIFAIFQRLHTRREYPGTGIGLAICKKIVERHGGKIGVESAPGQGSTFRCSFPA